MMGIRRVSSECDQIKCIEISSLCPDSSLQETKTKKKEKNIKKGKKGINDKRKHFVTIYDEKWDSINLSLSSVAA